MLLMAVWKRRCSARCSPTLASQSRSRRCLRRAPAVPLSSATVPTISKLPPPSVAISTAAGASAQMAAVSVLGGLRVNIGVGRSPVSEILGAAAAALRHVKRIRVRFDLHRSPAERVAVKGREVPMYRTVLVRPNDAHIGYLA